MLGRVVDSQMILSECGQVIQHVWDILHQRFPTLVLDAFQLMPNHLHAILVIPGTGLEPSLAVATGAAVIELGPQAVGTESGSRTPSMGEVVGAFKSISTIAVNRLEARPGRRLLQENFFEHIIRSVDELGKIRDYIRENPARWYQDPENPDRTPRNWPEVEWPWL
jgi:putative transposase